MSQTTISLLALATAMLIAVAQIHWSVQTQHRIVDDELEVMASGVARQILEYAESRSFDERTTPPEWLALGEPASVLDFDVMSNFGQSPDCNFSDLSLNGSRCDDIDDLDMGVSDWQEVPFVMDGDTMKFEANVKVYYIDDLNPEVRLTGNDRSFSKEVVVKIRNPIHVQQGRFKNGLVILRRLFIYDEANEALRSSVYVPPGNDEGTPTNEEEGFLGY